MVLASRTMLLNSVVKDQLDVVIIKISKSVANFGKI